MLVRAVARIDDAAAYPGREPMRCTACRVPYDDAVGAHCFQRQGGVLEALTLRHARPFGREVDDVCGQPFGSELERRTGAGGVFEEEVDDGAPAQRRQLLDRPVCDRGESFCCVEDEQGVVPAEIRGREKMPFHHASLPPVSSGAGSAGPSSTASRPSSSCNNTWTVSCKEVGMFLPT